MNALLLRASRELRGLLLVEGLLGPLDERHHVAHAEDPAGEAVGVEHLERVGLLAGAEELDRDAGDRADRQGRAAAGVAVDLGQHQAGDARPRPRSLRDGDRLLADHRVDDEQRLRPASSPSAHGADLGHQRLVDREPAGGVDDHDVAPDPLRVLDALAGDVDGRRADRVRDRPAMSRRLPSVSSWSAAAGRYGSAATSSGWRPCLTMYRASLAADVVLPEPWRPDERHDRRASRRAGTSGRRRRQDRGQLLVDDLDDLLAGVEALEDLGADRALAHAGHEVLDHLEVDVRLEQGEADLAHRGVDVRLGHAATAGQPGEGLAEAVAEVVEHAETATLMCWW